MAWSRSAKMRLLLGIFVGFLLVLAGGIWFVMRSQELAPTRREAADWIKLVFMSQKEARQQLEAELDKIRAAGEPLTIEEIVPPEVPDSENAAVLYQQAFDKLNVSGADKQVLGDLLSSMREPPKAEVPSLETLEKIVAKNATAIKLLEAAAKRPKCRFAIDWEAGLEAQFPHYAKMRKCARLLASKIYMETARGQVDSALQTAEISLAITEAILGEPAGMSQLYGYFIVGLTMPALQVALSRSSVTSNGCKHLYDHLAQMEFVESLADALLAERAMGIWYFGKVRHHPERAASVFDLGLNEAKMKDIYGSAPGQKIMDLDEITYLRLLWNYFPVARSPWREIAHATNWRQPTLDTVPRYCIITANLVPFVGFTPRKRDQVIAEVGLAQAALALKAYKNEKGGYPDSLDELRQVIPWELREDPFSGEDLIYQREGEGFVIYSIGPNLKDDGGIVSEDWEEGDIIWRCKK